MNQPYTQFIYKYLKNDLHHLDYAFFPQDSQLSAKHMFRCKIQSKIMDFTNNFELLHFQFDRWLYKTVSGLQFKFKPLVNVL